VGRLCKGHAWVSVKICKDAQTWDSSGPDVKDLVVTSNLTIPASDLKWRAVRSSGPGGQNVNKVSTKVELRFDLQQTQAISESVKSRLYRLASSHLDAQGLLVITAQSARTQRQNLEQTLGILTMLVQKSLIVPKKRKRTAPSAASRRRRLQAKRLISEKKQGRRHVSDE